ncbi:hypothetical protein NIES2101_33690 [Calothrix sp. HK-06]|nr:hypothetical protein NIES2101_33690 [Calothrix sp. HK-06]
MPQELNSDDIATLVDLLLISSKVRTREALCIRIGITYYRQLGFINDPTDESFAINLINHLNDVGNTKALCQLCVKELEPIFKGGRRESLLKEIAEKFNCNLEYEQNYSNSNSTEQTTSPTPNAIPEFRTNSPNQSTEAKSQSKKLYWLTGGAIFLIGLASFAGFYKTESVNPRYIQLQNLLSQGRWKDADVETADRMWGVAGQWEKRSLQAADYNNFPCEDLRAIDNLWTKYSKKRFGFSTQSRIFQSSDVNKNLDKFMIQVGWGKLNEKGEFYYMYIPEYSFSTPEGQFPWFVNWQGSGDRRAYMSRILSCGI